MTHRRITAVVGVLAIGTPLLLGTVAPAMAAEPVTVSFASTGAEQTFVVPDGVSSVHVVAIGGRGGRGFSSGGPGGFAHRAEGDLAVSAGQTLYVEVGGAGPAGSAGSGAPGGFNGGGSGGGGLDGGGGGGGGASDVRTVPRSDTGTLASRLIVAAGGGGGGAPGGIGGPGGAAGTAGSNATGGGTGGAAGTSTTGGTGGTGGGAGGPGGPGLGGFGGGTSSFSGGGGGGAGYFGGGGGGSGTSIFSAAGAGGGGGSSFTGDATNASVGADASGIPSIAITYVVGGDEPPAETGTVSAQVEVTQAAACLELSTATVDFGALGLGEHAQGTPEIEVTNCSDGSESILARGTDATGSTATWDLIEFAGCDTGVGSDEYGLALQQDEEDPALALSETNQTLTSLDPGASSSHTASIDTACPGSGGIGEVMSMQIVYLATGE